MALRVMLGFSCLALSVSSSALAGNSAAYGCRLYDSSSSQVETKTIALPGGVKDIPLADGLHSIELNNYEGQVYLFFNDAAGSEIMHSDFIGRYGSLSVASPSVKVTCSQE